MGWFWTSDDDDDKKRKDTFAHLKPEVREFLEREAPMKPSRNQVPSYSESPATSQPKPDFDPTAYSKYGDKYADIWAQYRPLTDIEAEARTPQMAINDVYQSYKQRQGGIGRAAVENCVFEQVALHECYGSGKMKKFTGCSSESKSFENCFTSQKEFLKRLGYMSDLDRDPEVDEKIQMHADRLYREQEKKQRAVSENAAAGRPLDTSMNGEEKPLF